MFIIILLLSTGWEILKPYLSDMEKKILFGLVLLQIINNIILIIIENQPEGASTWMFWKSLFIWMVNI
jgi:G protein-coupled receptor 107